MMLISVFVTSTPKNSLVKFYPKTPKPQEVDENFGIKMVVKEFKRDFESSWVCKFERAFKTGASPFFRFSIGAVWPELQANLCLQLGSSVISRFGPF